MLPYTAVGCIGCCWIKEQAPHYGEDYKVLSQLSSVCIAFNNLTIFYYLGTADLHKPGGKKCILVEIESKNEGWTT